jgi:hypothetical protein
MEQQVMGRLLESGVELTQCVLDGHRGCRFTIVGDEAQRPLDNESPLTDYYSKELKGK